MDKLKVNKSILVKLLLLNNTVYIYLRIGLEILHLTSHRVSPGKILCYNFRDQIDLKSFVRFIRFTTYDEIGWRYNT